ncbi:MAG: polysaccharide pyruvyl transferase CsaB [Candidatus Bruticola sp.]
MGKKILLSGYFGFDNIGDEAILEAECAQLRRLDPDVELSALIDNKARAEELRLRAYKRKSLWQIYKAISSCDLVISGGGGLFQDSTGVSSVMYYGAILAMAAILNKPSFIFSQGFGPIRTDLGKMLARQLLPLASRASFRDEESLQEFKKYAPKVEAVLTADPAFLLPSENKELSLAVWQRCGFDTIQAPIAVVSLRSWFGLELASKAEAFNNWLAEFSDEDRPHLLVLPMQYWYDEGISKRFISLLKYPCTLAPQLKADEIAALLAADKIEMAAAMRLHTVILAAAVSKATLGIAYDPKVSRICQLCGAPWLPLEKLKPAELSNKLRETWQNRVKLGQEIGENAKNMRDKALQAFNIALEMI